MSMLILEHTTDLKVRFSGRNPEELMINAAVGLEEIVYGKIACEDASERVEIKAEGQDLESLLAGWLSEILAFNDINGKALSHFLIIGLGDGLIRADCRACKARAQEALKSVAYDDLKVWEIDGRWHAQVIFKI